MPTFSVIIPAYNAERYLEQCVGSVLAQSYRDLEVIVVDDGSTDRTSAILEALAREDDRLKVVRVANAGVARARNLGVERASGEYVLFLDADDYWDDAAALAGLAALARTRRPDVMVWGYKRLFERTGRIEAPRAPLGDDLPHAKAELLGTLLRANRFEPSAWNKAIRRDLFADHDLGFEPDVQSEDIEWSARVARFAGRIAYYDNPFYVYRQTKGSRSKSFAEQDVHDAVNHFLGCREHAMAVNDEGVRAALLAFAAERYVELLTMVGRSRSTGEHLQRLRPYAGVLENGVTPYVQKYARARRLVGLGATVQVLRLKQAAWNLLRL